VAIAPVYTTRFIGVQDASLGASYTVPDDQVAVVTWLTAYRGPGLDPLDSSMFFRSVDHGWTVHRFDQSQGESESQMLELRCAFHPGETFEFATNDAWDATATGFLLSLAP
jgi:hypothetical protein